jgi:hypothetical protein
MRHRLDVALLSAFLVAFALTTSALAQPADLVLRGGKVITVDRDWRVAQAVAIRMGAFSRSATIPRSPATSGRTRR